MALAAPLCIKACPTDAIVGSNKKMHTVIEPYCTGCELCIPCLPWWTASSSTTPAVAQPGGPHGLMRWHFASSATSSTASGCRWKMSEDDGSVHRPIPQQPPCHQPPYRARRATAVAAEGMSTQAAIAAAMERARQLREKGSR